MQVLELRLELGLISSSPAFKELSVCVGKTHRQCCVENACEIQGPLGAVLT